MSADVLHDDIHPVSPERRRLVVDMLCDIERDHDVQIVFACESGSRGWGFSSPDSDYDVRFVYRHRPEWYVTVLERTAPGQPQRDVIELPIDAELDICGWDLRKALRLLDRSNLTLWEWLHSPIVYRADPTLAEPLTALASRFYDPLKAWHHYLSLAQGTERRALRGERIRTKKYFYALRPLLACAWLESVGSPPPMAFEMLLEHALPTGPVREAVDGLLARKRRSREATEEARIPVISEFIAERLATYAVVPRQVATVQSRAPGELDVFLRSAIGNAPQLPRSDTTHAAIVRGTAPTPR